MKKLITDVNIGETIEYFNNNWRTYHKGKVIKKETTKSGKSCKVLLENVFTKRDKWTGEEHYSIEKYGTYQTCGCNSEFTIKSTVQVEIL